MKIHTGDSIVVITGKDKGKIGTVLRVLLQKQRVVVTGINMRTKHIRRTPQQAGQRVRYEASIHVSNVMLLDPKTKKRTRIGYRPNEQGRKVRIAKRSGEVLKEGKKSAKAQVKATKESKELKEAPHSAPEGATRGQKDAKEGTVAPPPKQPFWKRLGFGKDAVLEEETTQGKREKGQGVPPEQRPPDSFAHQRGD